MNGVLQQAGADLAAHKVPYAFINGTTGDSILAEIVASVPVPA